MTASAQIKFVMFLAAVVSLAFFISSADAALILSCTDTATTAGQLSSNCATGNLIWTDAYVIPASSQAMIDMILTGGFDSGSFEIGFIGMLLMWVTGVGVGLIISMVRRARMPGRS